MNDEEKDTRTPSHGGGDFRQRAVALRYNRDKEHAPRIVAKGSGQIAERIIEVARAHGITIYEDKDLIELLSKLELYEVIPPQLYQVIAEILAFVYRLNKKAFEV
ncbi:EscU/YscU/HrcU family type III secretion system export apparatus switch protein [Candidatus Poribacteria bacterium]|nr:EscU/YscU/HrcU family type III secretion system export apparatus switch protein [Candidatus Poribacteria bacterium]